MSSSLCSKVRGSLLAALGCLTLAADPLPARAEAPTLDDALMDQAIRYLGVLSGHEIGSADGAWLKATWRDEAAVSPDAVAARIDELALGFERYQQAPDPMALAEGRTAVVKTAYCAGAHSSDPSRQRLKDIIAGDDVVLAADCMLNLVTTRFDVDGLIASHHLVATATGQAHDVASDRAEITQAIRRDFDDAAPQEKATLANGDLRHALLARFWERIEDSPEQQAVIDEIRTTASSDLRHPARMLENLAVSKLKEIDYVARVGDAPLQASAFVTYIQWFERIAGYSFNSRDRIWMEEAIVDAFRKAPQKVLAEIAEIEQMTADYHTTDAITEKNQLVARWAAGLYCYLSTSDDRDDAHMAEVIFRHDPVIEADCANNRITRKRHQVLAQANGQELQEEDLAHGLRFLAMLIGRPLLPDELSALREEAIRDFSADPDGWRKDAEQAAALLAEVERHDTSIFLGVDKRKTMFDPIYCAIEASNEPFAESQIEMFKRGGAILFEDCSRQVVTTADEVDSLVSLVDFLALLNERPRYQPAEVETLRQSVLEEDIDHIESSLVALGEWWSLLSLDEKAAEAAKARADGVTPEAEAETIESFLGKAKLDVVLRNAKRAQCDMMSIIAKGNTGIYAAKAGRYGLQTGADPVGFSGVELGTLITTTNMFAELCK